MASAGSSAFRRFLNSETGPKTVHFWAPVLKWAVVIAGIADLKRPVESLSGTQQIALFATGAIWTRWCLIIKPRNVMLASVNFFLGAVAGGQLVRIAMYNHSIGLSASESVKAILSG
ncbi:hypothetical protein CANCADRAFT_17684, partial [Tortispora caseinolytica NRRL Y-17796]